MFGRIEHRVARDLIRRWSAWPRLIAADTTLSAGWRQSVLRARPGHVNPTQREDTMSNPFTYAELHTKNAAAARAFYGQLFDWRLKDEPMPGGTYISVDTGDAVPGGLLEADEPAGSR